MTRSKLWQDQSGGELHSLIEKYTVGDDRVLDQRLLGYDIQATKAHTLMLQRIGILSEKEYEQLAETLDELMQKWKNGSFVVTKDHEDGHTAIELYLTEKLGAVGKKVHTGRSRNDQALVMMRLFVKDSLNKAIAGTNTVVDAYEQKVKEAGDQPMPGYTHSQKAMPTTVALWLGSYQDAFSDLLPCLKDTQKLINQNPLGSAAGFGVTLPLNRELTTTELGFAKVQDNPMYCGLSRGVFELAAVQSLSLLMVFAGKFAEDFLQFTMQESSFFSLPDSMTTGSSIMPHKRNYDVFEIMRANAHEFASHSMTLHSLVSSVGSGYHRDLQLTKHVTLRAVDIALETLEVLALCVNNMGINKLALDSAMTQELETVAIINKLVEQGTPFRDAYQQVKESLK